MSATAALLVATGSGQAAHACELQAEPGLAIVQEGKVACWQACGDHAAFALRSESADMPFPAGWYALHIRVECLEGSVTLPSIQLRFVSGQCVEVIDLPLPEPDAHGWVRSLVLFKFPVRVLRWCPTVWAAKFRLVEGSLRRLPRYKALWHMLFPAAKGEWCRRGVRYILECRRYGLSKATEKAYTRYLGGLRPSKLDAYELWVRQYDTFPPSRQKDMERRQAALSGSGIAFALLLPAGDAPVEVVQRCLEGIRRQTWCDWTLWVEIVDVTGAAYEHVCNLSASDGRVKIRRPGEGLPGACAEWLESTRHPYIIWLDAHCLLRRHALLEMAWAVHENPAWQWVYSDEDRLDAHGRRFQPFFKPDWNPELLCSSNYPGRLAVMRASLACSVGGLRTEYGDPWHDLHLRVSEKVAPKEIGHLPLILWHYLDAADVPAIDGSESGARAVCEHLVRQGADPAVRVVVQSQGGYRIHWPVPAKPPKISVIVPTRDRLALLRPCIESVLAKSTWPHVEVVVVDNGSVEPGTLSYLEHVQGECGVRVLRYDRPFNYALINNFAVEHCDSELVCLLNNDIEVLSPQWLEEMAGHAMRPGTGAVGAMLYYPDDTIQHAGVTIGLHGMADHRYAGLPRGTSGQGNRACLAQNLSAVTAACLLVRRKVYAEVGGLAEHLAVAFNDVDFCLRLEEAGYRNVWTPFAELYHHESATRGRDVSPVQRQRFDGELEYMRQRWPGAIAADPAYNPNLSLLHTDDRLAFPPRKPVGHGWLVEGG